MSIYKMAKHLSYHKQNIRYVSSVYPSLTPNKTIIVLYLSWYLYEKRNGRKSVHYLSWLFQDITC